MLLRNDTIRVIFSAQEKAADFTWNSKQRDFLLGAFFYGYISTQIPGGIMAAKLSIKWVFGYGIFLTSLLTLATYSVAWWSYSGFVVLRILEGITEVSIHFASNTSRSKLENRLLGAEVSHVLCFVFRA